MADAHLHRMTADAFLTWDIEQSDCRHELVDGSPMAIAWKATRHDEIVVNTVACLAVQLRGGPCRASTADSGIRIPNGNVRRPDAAVDCGPRRPDDLSLRAPTLIVEVLSRSTRLVDHHRKMEDYKLLPSLTTYLLVNQESARVTAMRRAADGTWRFEEYLGLEAEVTVEDLGIVLSLADLYDGVELDPDAAAVSP